MLKLIRRILCRHSWHVCTKVSGGYVTISGEWLYKRCTKCGKTKKWIYAKFEGGGYR